MDDVEKQKRDRDFLELCKRVDEIYKIVSDMKYGTKTQFETTTGEIA